MSRLIAIVVFLVSVISVCGVNAEMHDFSLQDGRILEAEIVDYNAKLVQVELKRTDGKRVKVQPSIFVENDQEYIQEWASLDGFRNKSFFKVECKKNTVEKWKEDGNIHEVRHERLEYEVSLENRSAVPIKNLKVEYCIYYEQEKSLPGQKKTTAKLSKVGKLDIDKLATKEKRTLATESVVLNRYDFNSTDFYYDSGDPESARGELKGIWLRLTVSVTGGQKVVRDLFEPSSIEGKYTWQERSTPPPTKGKKKS